LIFGGSPRTLPSGADAAGGTAVTSKFYEPRDNLLVRAHMRSRMGGWRLTLVHGPTTVDDVFMPRFIEELFDWIDSADSVFPPPIPPRGKFASGR
jgi:hypothetical protein